MSAGGTDQNGGWESHQYEDGKMIWGRPGDEDEMWGDDASIVHGPEAYETVGLGAVSVLDLYPGDNAYDAMHRTKRLLARLEKHTGQRGCVRRESFIPNASSRLLVTGLKPGSSGRLSTWIDLEVDESLFLGSSLNDADEKAAGRIARYLERRGHGRFIVFLDTEDLMWVKRVELASKVADLASPAGLLTVG
ncbi:hypothetical protein [Sphingobium cupriresistens]|uniref:Uncharacterized protein n=1 Tax=Sphingobium cupriresistens LL01 TaxID=1420583 RepID=A0A0J7XT31_9SPHN|nr:hypothetical protein [Sphingobium cupriresistens]KMS54183.1 hypothetical protein V473_17860 [Sphingobium cupriresistens LL01]